MIVKGRLSERKRKDVHSFVAIRATVLSAPNLIMRLLYALLIPIAGQIVDAISVVRAFTILGVFTLLAGTGMLLTLHRKHVL